MTRGIQKAIPNDMVPDEAFVREHLARILGSSEFVASERLRGFLRYIVEETLEGRGERIKAFTVALSVFGRSGSFDPQTDPVVRIEAGRLRRSLERYYLTAGKSDPIRIIVPKGAYVPQFEILPVRPQVSESPVAESDAQGQRPTTGPPRSKTSGHWRDLPRSSRLKASALLSALLLALIVSLLWPGRSERGQQTDTTLPHAAQSRPAGVRSLLVMPFADVAEATAQSYLARGFTEELIAALTPFKELFVFAPETSFAAGTPTGVSQLRQSIGLDYVLSGSVQRAGDGISVTAQLLDARTGAIGWAGSYSRSLAQIGVLEIRQEIATNIVKEIAHPYGAMAVADLRHAVSSGSTSPDAYDCVLRAYDYQRNLRRRDHPEIRRCLEQAVAQEPDYAEAWALLAGVYVDDERFRFTLGSSAASLENALAAAEKAVALAPGNARTHQAMMLVRFRLGQFASGLASGRRALELNPHDSEVLAQYGMRLALTGDWERGVELMRAAIGRNPSHPGWYHFALALNEYRLGHYQEALSEAVRIDSPDAWQAHLVLAMIHGALGQDSEAKQAVSRLTALYPNIDERIWEEMWQRGIPRDTGRQFVEGLRRAGLKVAPERDLP